MDTSLISLASKQYSGLVLNEYYSDIAKTFLASPLYISDSMKVNVLKDTSSTDSDDTNVETIMGLHSPATVRHTTLDTEEHTLIGRVVEEPIPITNTILAAEMNYNLTETAMVKCAHKLGKDLLTDLNTALTNSSNFLSDNTIDLSGGTYVQWSNTADATPREDVFELIDTITDLSGIDDDDPRLTAIMSKSIYHAIIATADYTSFKADKGVNWVNNKIARMQDYLEVPNVVIYNDSLFGDFFVLAIVEQPKTGLSVQNANTNISGLITGAYNLPNVNQPLEIELANGIKVSENRVFIGARKYTREDGLATNAQAFTWNKIWVHNKKGLAHFTNITA